MWYDRIPQDYTSGRDAVQKQYSGVSADVTANLKINEKILTQIWEENKVASEHLS